MIRTTLIARVRELAGQGKSGPEIAAATGLTRSAMRGLAQRNGIRIVRQRHHRKGLGGPLGVVSLLPAIPAGVFKPRVLVASWPAPGRCVWPHGEPGEAGFRFCGKAVEAMRPYCAAHERQAHPTAS